MIELSILFVNYNTWRELVAAVRSVLEHPPKRPDGQPMTYEVIVIDNRSPLRDAHWEAELVKDLARCNGRLVMHDENGGYSKGMNLAYRMCHGDLVLVSNPDVLYEPGCIDTLIRALLEDPSIGAAAPEGFWDEGLDGRLPPNILPTLADLFWLTWAALSPSKVHRYSRVRTADAVRVWEATKNVDLPMLSGCSFVMRRSDIEAMGGAGRGPFDEQFPLYFEDTDLSMSVRKAGKRVVQIYGAHLVHLYNRSGQTDHKTAMERYWISRERYYRKWYGQLGVCSYRFSQWLLATKWAKRRALLPVQSVIHDLGRSFGKPVAQFDRARRFLVEIALDPHFYLAAGVFGSGASWTPSDSLFAGFGPTIYFFRIVDLDDRQQPIGIYRYQRLAAPEPAVATSSVEGN